jgi:hypothetical protein
MRRDALNILHDRDRLLEDLRVDTLQDEPCAHSGTLHLDAVRVIDVTGAVGLGAEKLARELKLARNSADIKFQIYVQSFLG